VYILALRFIFRQATKLATFGPPFSSDSNIINVCVTYEGWNFNSGNYLFTTDTK